MHGDVEFDVLGAEGLLDVMVEDPPHRRVAQHLLQRDRRALAQERGLIQHAAARVVCHVSQNAMECKE